MTETMKVQQGTDYTLALDGWTDANEQPVNIDGWTIHAVARADGVRGPIVAEWHTTPTGTQGQAIADGTQAALVVTHDMSGAWDFGVALLHVEATAPDGKQARIAEVQLYLDRTTVYAP